MHPKRCVDFRKQVRSLKRHKLNNRDEDVTRSEYSTSIITNGYRADQRGCPYYMRVLPEDLAEFVAAWPPTPVENVGQYDDCDDDAAPTWMLGAATISEGGYDAEDAEPNNVTMRSRDGRSLLSPLVTSRGAFGMVSVQDPYRLFVLLANISG